MIEHYKVQGVLPIWTLWGKENNCMIANHAIPIIADAFLKGFRGFDISEAYAAVKASSTVSHKKSDWEVYDKYGYYPYDIIKTESVSRTLESGYDDYCVSQMAKALGNVESLRQVDYKKQEKLEVGDDLSSLPEHVAFHFSLSEKTLAYSSWKS